MDLALAIGVAASAVCVVGATRARRSPTAHVYPPLTRGAAALARGLRLTAVAMAAAGVAWALLDGTFGGSVVWGLDLVLGGCAVRRLLVLWRQSQARMIWAPEVEVRAEGRPPLTS